jgi:hypothetical protein
MKRASYLDRMDAFRSGAQPAVSRPPRAPNPISVDRGYPRRASLEANLVKYYESCIRSKAAKKLTGDARKRYCAGVAWRRARESGRYADYPAFAKVQKESAMASKKKGGGKKGKLRGKAKAAFLRRMAAGRSKAKRKASRPKVKTTRASAPRKSARRSAAAKKAARTRKRNATAAAAHTETPKRKRKSGGGKKRSRSEAAKKAARTRKRNSNRRRASARRGAAKATVRRKARRTLASRGTIVVGGKPQPVSVRVTTMGEASHRRTRHSARRSGGSSRRTYSRNPMGSGEFLAAAATAGVGLIAGELLDRWLATYAANKTYAAGETKPATLNDATAVLTAPGVGRVAAQGALALAPIGAAMWVRNPLARSVLQGAAIGVGAGLIKTLVMHFVLVKFFATKSDGSATAFGSRLLAPEASADASKKALADASTGVGRLPQGVGRPFGAGAGRVAARDPGPRAAPPVGVGAPPAPIPQAKPQVGVGDAGTLNCDCEPEKKPEQNGAPQGIGAVPYSRFASFTRGAQDE